MGIDTCDSLKHSCERQVVPRSWDGSLGCAFTKTRQTAPGLLSRRDSAAVLSTALGELVSGSRGMVRDSFRALPAPSRLPTREVEVKILVSTHLIGGAGGAERALFSVMRALREDHVDVVVREKLGGKYAEHGTSARVFDNLNWRWRGAGIRSGLKGVLVRTVINPLRKLILPRYDVYLQFRSGPSVGGAVRARVRVLIPSGNMVPPELASEFDAIALQAPGNTIFVPEGVRSVLLPPPVLPLAEGSAQLPDLPDEYLLTVFNPYGRIKGLDDLISSLEQVPYPLVWCHSQATLKFEIPESLRKHPRVIHVEDPSEATMRELYKGCHAYISFSKSEGFGWSIADALRYSPQIVARKVGVLTYSEVDRDRFIEVPSEWSVQWDKLRSDLEAPRDIEWLSAERFRTNLQRIAKEIS